MLLGAVLGLPQAQGEGQAYGNAAATFRYGQVVTEKGTLNMRAEPKDGTKVLAKLSKGLIVRILQTGEEWTQVLHEGAAGYVKNAFLQEIEELPYSVLRRDDKGEGVLAFKRALYKLEYLKSDDINSRFDQKMETALIKLQLVNGIELNPEVVTPELQAMMTWGMLEEGKSGYLGTEVDEETGLMVSVFCWDSAGTLYEDEKAVKLKVSFAAQAAGGVPPYAITVKKSISARGGAENGDEVTSPFSHLWREDTGEIYLYATVVDAAGNTVTACTPFRYTLPARYLGN